jgi:hypothetical protein
MLKKATNEATILIDPFEATQTPAVKLLLAAHVTHAEAPVHMVQLAPQAEAPDGALMKYPAMHPVQ